MKYLLILFLFVISNQFFAQKTKIQILNFEDNIPVENVHIYNDSILIDKTNKDGFFKINTSKINKISIIKEDFFDTIVNISNVNKTIYLKKINAIVLKEVIISNLRVESILDSTYSNIKKLKNISISQNLHFFNSLTAGNDTLSYINKRLLYKNRDGYYCENDNKIINNFKLTTDKRPIYFLKNNEIGFNYNYIHFSEPYISPELQIITKFKENFTYSLIKSDGYYKITFEHKKGNKEFPYNGFLIIDCEDYGIYEFSCKTTIDKRNKRNILFKDDIINFRILNEESFIKYRKNENGKYELITYKFDSQLLTLDGYFKGIIFTNKCRKEPTFSFDYNNIKKIDLSTYKLIK